MPKQRNSAPAVQESAVWSGRPTKEWTPERKEIAQRIALVRDAYGSGRKLKKVAGRTPQDWCAPQRDEHDAWARVSQPSTPNLLRFAQATSRNLEWLLTGKGPERCGEKVAPVALADAFAAAALVRCQAVVGHGVPLELDAAQLLEFALAHVVETFVADQRAQEAASALRGRVGALAHVATDEPTNAAAATRKKAWVRSAEDRLIDTIGAVAPPRRVAIAPAISADRFTVPVFGQRPRQPAPAVAIDTGAMTRRKAK